MKRIRVASFADLQDDEGLQVDVGGRLIALFKQGGGVKAVGDSCPHMGAPLSDGYLDQGTVVCPWHGWMFNLDTGESPFDEEACVPVYRAVVEDGEVILELDVDDAEPARPAGGPEPGTGSA